MIEMYSGTMQSPTLYPVQTACAVVSIYIHMQLCDCAVANKQTNHRCYSLCH